MSKLERAKALLDAGALTPEEFDAEKARLLPGSSSTFVDQSYAVAAEPEEGETSVRSRWMRLAIAATITIVAATIAYLLLADRSPSPAVENPAPLPTATPRAATPAPAASPTPTPTPTEAEFGCIGA